MNKILISILSLFFALRPLPLVPQSNTGQQALSLYEQARKLFDLPEPTPQTDSLALGKFLHAAKLLPPGPENGLIIFYCYEKAGILRQTYGLQQASVELYKKAINTRAKYALPDSLLFKPYMYCGNAYYFQHAFDSAVYYFEKAEEVLLRFPQVAEAERLYNSFGAIYYEAGDYKQSINYFHKALQLEKQQQNPDEKSVYSFTSNIASALRHLELYDSAANTYKSLLPLNMKRSDVLINLGATYNQKKEPDSALYYLKQVHKPENIHSIELENTLGHACLQKNDIAGAIAHFQEALRVQQNQKAGNSNRKNHNIGLTYKLLADIEKERLHFGKALQYYQQSVIQLDGDFNDTLVFRNPTDFTEGFSSFLLFETLSSKALCLQQLYQKTLSQKYLDGVIHTYYSAFRLAEHIEKSFDSEESRLFIVQKVFPVYQKAVALLVTAYEHTRDKHYLEEAFRWTEKSKAVVLKINLKENDSKFRSGIPVSLLAQERNLKFNRSRLFVQLDKATDSTQQASILAEIRDNELAMSRFVAKLHDYPDYYRKKFSSDSIDIAAIQRKVRNASTALLTYFQGSNQVYAFVLTGKAMYHYTIPGDSTYTRAFARLGTALRTTSAGQNYDGSHAARILYDKLIKPAEKHLSRVASLIIVPHNELRLLPFEVLEDSRHRYLLEKFDITYQYTVSFLENAARDTPDLHKALSVAPFSAPANAGAATVFTTLPASSQEIEQIQGNKLKEQEATKANFTRLAKAASVIHLATHAVADNTDPSRSYVAFYPDSHNDYKLYAHEIHSLHLPDAHLVFLSACETASGKVIHGEGIMSLSRAFSNAGCSNLVTSLWKAEDRATAYISSRFYTYLQKGYPYAKALQSAKSDLLHNADYAQFHSPQHWAPLIFIGIPTRHSKPFPPPAFIWLSAGLLICLAIFFLYRKRLVMTKE
jgi:CHAT domain-containing protein/Tfp pilus assembly protein PilF